MFDLLKDPTILLLIAAVASFGAAYLSRNRFAEMNTKIKKLEVLIVQKNKTANLNAVKLQIDTLFKKNKIDGFEREYLHKRLKNIETQCKLKNHSAPTCAAGGPEDRI